MRPPSQQKAELGGINLEPQPCGKHKEDGIQAGPGKKLETLPGKYLKQKGLGTWLAW
jgi:hypothetical protein